MVSPGYRNLPQGTPGKPVPFSLNIPDKDLEQLSSLIRNAVIAEPSFYNTHSRADDPSYSFGATRDWLIHAVDAWANKFDWRAHEKHWNAFPQYTIDVTPPSNGQVFNLHFAALFSRKEDAVPVIFSHGWPSSWLDFVPLLDLLAARYTPDTLPYHVVVPSIPDFGLSTRSDLAGTELDFYTAAEALNELMKALGFDAYIAQGGDVGSCLTAALGERHAECKAVLFNNVFVPNADRAAVAGLPVTPEEQAALATAATFFVSEMGYMHEQATKPSTLSQVVMSNPVAMLQWLAEFTPSRGVEGISADGLHPLLDATLQQVSWYWLTRSYGRALWPYRIVWPAVSRGVTEGLPRVLSITNKPLGYSWFPGEVLSLAKSWLDKWFPENLVFFRYHEKGGHLAALDEPAAFLQDVEEFVTIVNTKIKF